MQRSGPDSERPDAPPRDLELIALRYVDERDAAQKLVRAAAKHLVRDPPASLKDEHERRRSSFERSRPEGRRWSSSVPTSSIGPPGTATACVSRRATLGSPRTSSRKL